MSHPENLRLFRRRGSAAAQAGSRRRSRTARAAIAPLSSRSIALRSGASYGEVAALGRRVAEGVVRDALVEQAGHVAAGRVVRLAIDRHALGLQTVVELVDPRRLHGERRR